MLFRKLGALQVLERYKLSFEMVDQFEERLNEYEDTPEDFEPTLLSGKIRRQKRKAKEYQGKTPRTNLKPKHPFDHVFDMHDEYARNNTHDFGVLGEYPFR